MTDLQKVETLIGLVKQPEYYVPRNYQTIGGMWTTDTYERDGVRVQVMDEGYSTSIYAENLIVWVFWDVTTNKDWVEFREGNIVNIENLLVSFTK